QRRRRELHIRSPSQPVWGGRGRESHLLGVRGRERLDLPFEYQRRRIRRKLHLGDRLRRHHAERRGGRRNLRLLDRTIRRRKHGPGLAREARRHPSGTRLHQNRRLHDRARRRRRPHLEGVAVDAGHVYWTNAITGTIGRATLEGTATNQEFIKGQGTLIGVAVSGEY